MNDSKIGDTASFDPNFNPIFNPNNVGLAANQIFGLPCSETDAAVVLVPAPWDATVSYGCGTKDGPAAIRAASYQVDLLDQDFPDGWKNGFAMQDISAHWARQSDTLRAEAIRYMKFLQDGGNLDANDKMRKIGSEIDAGCEKFRQWMKSTTEGLLARGKLVGVVGGDHSTPLGYMQAIAEKFGPFGILQIDAHCDLRNAYEGLKFSHASIMHNALQIPQVEKLVQVGIRDLCDEEAQVIEQSPKRIASFSDSKIKNSLYDGRCWREICEEIVFELPAKVYVSFDIDGLDPKLCPHTGTPVPGGLEYEQAIYLIRMVVKSGRRVLGFDLSEVSPGDTEWDANVGARLLYKLCNLALLSNTAA